MRAEIHFSEDTTTLYLRYEVIPEGREAKLLTAMTGPLVLAISCERYMDASGKFHAEAEVEVPIHPHAGTRNFGQARFSDSEARRVFAERLQAAVMEEVAGFIHEHAGADLPIEGHTIRVETARTPAPPVRIARATTTSN